METTGSPNGEAVEGGLWGTSRANERADVISRKFCRLVEALVRNDMPMTFLSFPRLALDADYLFGKISFAMPGVSRSAFLVAFRKISRPDLIHDFRASEGEAPPATMMATSWKPSCVDYAAEPKRVEVKHATTE